MLRSSTALGGLPLPTTTITTNNGYIFYQFVKVPAGGFAGGYLYFSADAGTTILDGIASSPPVISVTDSAFVTENIMFSVTNECITSTPYPLAARMTNLSVEVGKRYVINLVDYGTVLSNSCSDSALALGYNEVNHTSNLVSFGAGYTAYRTNSAFYLNSNSSGRYYTNSNEEIFFIWSKDGFATTNYIEVVSTNVTSNTTAGINISALSYEIREYETCVWTAVSVADATTNIMSGMLTNCLVPRYLAAAINRLGVFVTNVVVDDDTTGPVLTSFVVNGGASVTDAQMTNGNYAITGLVQDVQSGVNSNTATAGNNRGISYSIRSPNGVYVVVNQLFTTAPADGSAWIKAEAVAGNAARAGTGVGASSEVVLGVYTVQVTAVDNDEDASLQSDRAVTTSDVATFTVVDDDTTAPTQGVAVAGAPMGIFIGTTNYPGSDLTTNALFTISDHSLAHVDGENLVVNPYFEDGLLFYTSAGSGVSISGTAAEDGTNGVLFAGSGGGVNEVFQYNSFASAGIEVHFSVRARAQTNYLAAATQLGLAFYDSTGTTLLSSQVTMNVLSDTNWQSYYVRATAPVGVSSTRTWVASFNPSSAASSSRDLFVDNWTIKMDSLTPLRMTLSAYDTTSGVKFSTDNSSNVTKLSVGSAINSNAQNWSSAFSSTTTTTSSATNSWAFYTLNVREVSMLYNSGTNRVNALLVNNDSDRLNDAESVTSQFGRLYVPDEDVFPPVLGTNLFSNNASFYVAAPLSTNAPSGSGTNILYRLSDADLATTTGSPIPMIFNVYDTGSGIDVGISYTNKYMSLTIQNIFTNNLEDYQKSLSSTNTTVATATNVWNLGSPWISPLIIDSLVDTTSKVTAIVPDKDDDRIYDTSRLTNQQFGYLSFYDDDVDPPVASNMAVNGISPATTNFTDGLMRVGAWHLSMEFYDPSIIYSTIDRFAFGWSLENNAGTIIQSGSWLETSNIAVDGSAVWGRSIVLANPKESVDLGTWRVFWTASDLDNDRLSDRSGITNESTIFGSGNEIVIIDDDTNAPTTPSNLVVDPAAWTNENNFLLTWTHAVDNSGISEYRFDTNSAAPSLVTDGAHADGVIFEPSLSFTNLDCEIGEDGDTIPDYPAHLHSWSDVSTDGEIAQFSSEESFSGTNSLKLTTSNYGSDPNPHYAEARNSLQLNNTNHNPITISFSGNYKGDLSAYPDAIGYMAVYFIDTNGQTITFYNTREYVTNNPTKGANITSWTNLYFITNGPPNTEYVSLGFGLDRGQNLTCYWDTISVTILLENATTGIITNAPEGVCTSWFFAVDGDDDRVNDTLKGPNTNFVTMLDQTPPPRVTNFLGTAGADETSEVLLTWDPAPHAGNRASDGATLSPWRTYRIYYTTNSSGPTTNDNYYDMTTYPELATNVTTTITFSNLYDETTYRYAMKGTDQAGNQGDFSETVEVTTVGFIVTQGLASATSQVDVLWKAYTNRNYDALYVDATSFSDTLTNQWQFLTTITNDNIMSDTGSATRIMPSQLGNTMRFYRVSREGEWRTNNNPRRASREVYVAKSMTLVPGENWHSLCMVPDTNTLSYVFGTNRLPSDSSIISATKISWYDVSSSAEATCVVWLASSGNWLYSVGGSGLANDKLVPLDQGFNIELPTSVSTQSLVVVGRVPTNEVVVSISGGIGYYSILSYNVPRQVTVDELGLHDAGLRRGPNIGSADEIRVLDNRDGAGSLVSPKYRFFMHTDGRFRRSTAASSSGSGEGLIIEPDDAIIILRKGTGTLSWTNRTYYSSPTRTMTP